MKDKIYRHISDLPIGIAGNNITKGCIVLEGGGWKGLYTVGVLDCLMQNNINFSSVTGVSAGALSALGYLSGQIGLSARVDLGYRHDKNYCGMGAMKRDHGITGFSYLFGDILGKELKLNRKRLNDPSRRLAVSATNMITGRITYFEKGSCNLSRAVQASATVPYISRPVTIKGVPYLDGGCAEKIPWSWAEKCGEEKIVVVRTRELSYRRKPGLSKMAKVWYGDYPDFLNSLAVVNEQFNDTVEMLERKAKSGEIFLVAPSEPVRVKRFDGDMDKLGALYWLGYNDMMANMDKLREYLGNSPD